MTSQPPLWTRNFIFICLAHVCMTIAFYANMPVLPLFLKDRLGAEGVVMGLVVASYTASSILSRPVAGFWLDRVGRMILYAPSYLLFGLLFFAYPLAGAIAAITLLRLTHGVLWGAMMGAANTLAVDLIPPWPARGGHRHVRPDHEPGHGPGAGHRPARDRTFRL